MAAQDQQTPSPIADHDGEAVVLLGDVGGRPSRELPGTCQVVADVVAHDPWLGAVQLARVDTHEIGGAPKQPIDLGLIPGPALLAPVATGPRRRCAFGTTAEQRIEIAAAPQSLDSIPNLRWCGQGRWRGRRRYTGVVAHHPLPRPTRLKRRCAGGAASFTVCPPPLVEPFTLLGPYGRRRLGHPVPPVECPLRVRNRRDRARFADQLDGVHRVPTHPQQHGECPGRPAVVAAVAVHEHPHAFRHPSDSPRCDRIEPLVGQRLAAVDDAEVPVLDLGCRGSDAIRIAPLGPAVDDCADSQVSPRGHHRSGAVVSIRESPARPQQIGEARQSRDADDGAVHCSVPFIAPGGATLPVGRLADGHRARSLASSG